MLDQGTPHLANQRIVVRWQNLLLGSPGRHVSHATAPGTVRVPGAVAGRRVQDRLIGHASIDRLLHGVVDLQDQPLRAVLPIPLLVLAPHDRERVQDVIGVLARNAVQVEERRIQLRPQQRRRSGSHRNGGPSSPRSRANGSMSHGSVSQFKYPIGAIQVTLAHAASQRRWPTEVMRAGRELFYGEEVEVRAAQLLPC